MRQRRSRQFFIVSGADGLILGHGSGINHAGRPTEAKVDPACPVRVGRRIAARPKLCT
ncbi:hypothetical protein F8B43_2964 [Methylorubrum populi]|uniref:Uncharacterized protein n=1 Tax=Methylorubrum populi TaxID=223967 RepID=A0A833MZ16_9HYPH|nr:hypothetical protein F8B43_2964 [Methylorubrum populi]